MNTRAILKNILKNKGVKDPENLTTTEATEIINEFYEVIVLNTIGVVNLDPIYFKAHEALEEIGFGELDLVLASK